MRGNNRADSENGMSGIPSAQTQSIHVLLVDDEDAFRQATARRLELRGFSVSQACDGREADVFFDNYHCDVVVCDLKMPNMDGAALLQKRIESAPATSWIILTGQASVETAVSTLKLGAVEYLQKPIDIEDLEFHIHRAYDQNSAVRVLNEVRHQMAEGQIRFGIVGTSRHIQETYEFICKSAKNDQPVLITGESGTGKELIARGIHAQSDRAARPFVAINCSSLSDMMLADELFGHVQTAETQSVGTKAGLLEVTDGGTLFIDEAADLSLANQSALARTIETGQFRRCGDYKDRVADVRIIASTQRDLPHLVQQKIFRKDFYYRLNVLPWTALPLRERRDDIPLLIQHLLDRHGRRTGEPKRLSPESLVALQGYDWPGNIREMANVIERAAALCNGYTIRAHDLHLGLGNAVATPQGLSEKLDDLERDHILRVLESHHGNKLAAAKSLGISRMKLYRKLRLYGIE